MLARSLVLERIRDRSPSEPLSGDIVEVVLIAPVEAFRMREGAYRTIYRAWCIDGGRLVSVEAEDITELLEEGVYQLRSSVVQRCLRFFNERYKRFVRLIRS